MESWKNPRTVSIADRFYKPAINCSGTRTSEVLERCAPLRLELISSARCFTRVLREALISASNQSLYSRAGRRLPSALCF